MAETPPPRSHRAGEQRAWPACAEDYVLDAPDKYVDDQHAWKDCYQNDPRPNAGITCNGRYLPDDPFDLPAGHCRRKYHCVPCGLRKVIPVDIEDARSVVTFACPACRTQQPHAPVGRPTRHSPPAALQDQ